MDIVVRGLTEQDWADALVLAECVFGVGPWLFHSQHKSSLDRRFSDASGAWVDGELVSLVDVFFRQVRMPDGQTAKMGGIGTVCTHPQFRGQGLSGRLINRADQVMLEQGADWSMLFTGVQNHYARYGWVEVPTYWLEKPEIDSPTPMPGPIAVEMKDWWKPNEPLLISELYSLSANGVPVACIRDEQQWNYAVRTRLNRPECRTFVAKKEGIPSGYLAVKLGEGIEIVEAGGDAESLATLAAAACELAKKEGKAKLEISLPKVVLEKLPEWLTEGTVEKSGNWTMVKAINSKWSQADLEQMFATKQAHHFSLDNF